MITTTEGREELRSLHDCARDTCGTARCPEYLAFDAALDGLDIAEEMATALKGAPCQRLRGVDELCDELPVELRCPRCAALAKWDKWKEKR